MNEMEQLLTEAEDTLYFVSSVINLARITDYDDYGADIDAVLAKAAEIANKTQEKITSTLLMQHIATNKTTGD